MFLYPETHDQGDPYLLAAPEGSAKFRSYFYTTGRDGSMAFRTYGSNDPKLNSWEYLGYSLKADSVPREYWAPCVIFVPSLGGYVMLYSYSEGVEEFAHVRHRIRHAFSKNPEGPFADSGINLTADYEFAIDPDVYTLPGGGLRMAFATDFVEEEPLGTGIVEVKISEHLDRITSPPRVLKRATHPWHVYEKQRKLRWMNIPGVNWERDAVLWNTIEAPVGGLVNPQGNPVYLYSGGNFADFYAIGALVEENGVLTDVTGEDNFVVGPRPELGFFSPGHCAWFNHENRNYLILHAKAGSTSAPRNALITELFWDNQGRPYCRLSN